MTTINIDMRRASAPVVGPQLATDVKVETAWARRELVAGSSVIRVDAPAYWTLTKGVGSITAGGTGEANALRITFTEGLPTPLELFVRVPNTGTVNLNDLELVDPATLEPTAQPVAAWWLAVQDQIQDAHVDGDGHLIMTTRSGDDIDAGLVAGPGSSNTAVAGYVAEAGPTRDEVAARALTTVRTDAEALASQNAKALRRFHVALADQSTPTDIVAVGDSITEGLGATSWRNRWTNVFVEAIRRVHQPEGIPGGAGYFNGWNQSSFPDWPLDPASPIPNTDFGLGRQSLIMTEVGNSTIIDTSPVITGLDVLAVKTTSNDGSSKLRIQMDSDPHVDHDMTNGAVQRGGYRIPVRGLTRGEHVNIFGSAAGNVYFEGVYYFDGDEEAGVRMWEAGQSGYGAKDYCAPNIYWTQSLVEINPALMIAPIISNDYEGGRTPDQWAADFTNVHSTVTAALGYTPSWVLPLWWERTHSGWEEFRAKAREVTADLGVALVDFTTDFGPWEADLKGGLMSPDLHHPSNGGYNVIGQKMAREVMP